MIAIVEQSAVPQIVAAFGTFMEIEMVAAIKHVQAVEHVFRSVTVDHVEQNGNSHTMSRINELFQIVGSPVATASSEETVDLIAEACIVCMLHDGHQLDDIVTQVLDPREDILRKLLVGSNLWLGRGDADVSFVYTSTGRLGWAGILEHIALFLGRVPEACIIDGRDAELLGDTGDPSGNTLLTCMVIGHDERDLAGISLLPCSQC